MQFRSHWHSGRCHPVCRPRLWLTVRLLWRRRQERADGLPQRLSQILLPPKHYARQDNLGRELAQPLKCRLDVKANEIW